VPAIGPICTEGADDRAVRRHGADDRAVQRIAVPTIAPFSALRCRRSRRSARAAPTTAAFSTSGARDRGVQHERCRRSRRSARTAPTIAPISTNGADDRRAQRAPPTIAAMNERADRPVRDEVAPPGASRH
jgi:hypothetical protein